MWGAIDHLTVITQRLHRLPLDTFPSNCTANMLLGHICVVLLLIFVSWLHMFVFCSCKYAFMLVILTLRSFMHAILIWEYRCCRFKLLLSPSVLHLASLNHLILNKYYFIATPSAHFLNLLPYSWENSRNSAGLVEKSVVSISLPPGSF